MAGGNETVPLTAFQRTLLAIGRRFGLSACSAIAVLPGIAVSAQRPPAISLRPANATLAVEFSVVSSIRELSDGRVLITDAKEQRLVVADLRAGTVSEVGRRGEGPGEYRFVERLMPLRGDSSFMPSGGRWLMLDGARIVATLAGDAPAVAAATTGLIGADGLELVYVRRGAAPLPQRPLTTTRGDSAWLLRVSRASGRVDTLARLRATQTTLRTMSFGSAKSQRWTPPAFLSDDDAIPFADGWIAIARLEPYRVDWLSRDGRVQQGAPFHVALRRVEERDRQALIDSFPSRPGRMPDRDWTSFPVSVPPFQAPAMLASPDGRVLIQRTITASEPSARYDIVNRVGVLVAELLLSRGQRIVGFGAKSVYVATTDESGIQHVSRHPWP